MERNKETQERNMVWTQDIHIYNPKQLQLVVIAATSSVKYNFSEWLFKYAQLVFVWTICKNLTFEEYLVLPKNLFSNIFDV